MTVSYINQENFNVDTCKQLEEQRETINHLQKERIGHLTKILELKNKVFLLNSQLENVLNQVRMMTTGTDVLDKMLESQIKGKPGGIGFTHEHLRQEYHNSSYSHALEYYQKDRKKKHVRKIKFVASSKTGDTTVEKPMLEHPVKPDEYKLKKESSSWKCHCCNKQGHHKPFCYRLYGYPMRYQPKLYEPVVNYGKMEWRPKCVGLIAHTSLRASSNENWYFDSGCSRHMQGWIDFLKISYPILLDMLPLLMGQKEK